MHFLQLELKFSIHPRYQGSIPVFKSLDSIKQSSTGHRLVWVLVYKSTALVYNGLHNFIYLSLLVHVLRLQLELIYIDTNRPGQDTTHEWVYIYPYLSVLICVSFNCDPSMKTNRDRHEIIQTNANHCRPMHYFCRPGPAWVCSKYCDWLSFWLVSFVCL